jgi:hypothetical protein
LWYYFLHCQLIAFIGMIIEQFREFLATAEDSKRAIAQRAGVRPELLSRLERQQSCDLATFEKIAQAMNLEIVVRPVPGKDTAGGAVATVAQAVQSTQSKAQRLGLALPYDWSNPHISDRALILKALEYAHLPDLTRLALHFGMAALESALATLPPAQAQSAARVLPNIRAALS